jgi:hypothetical protein
MERFLLDLLDGLDGLDFLDVLDFLEILDLVAKIMTFVDLVKNFSYLRAIIQNSYLIQIHGNSRR